MIEGVKVKKLNVINDERGYLAEMLRHDDELFTKFGQSYVTAIYPGVVKAWHKHEKQYDNFVVVSGMAKIVCYDDRPQSPTYKQLKEFFVGEKNMILLQIAPGIMHGLKAIGGEKAIVINHPSQAYNVQQPDEIRVDPHQNEIPYKWEIQEK